MEENYVATFYINNSIGYFIKILQLNKIWLFFLGKENDKSPQSYVSMIHKQKSMIAASPCIWKRPPHLGARLDSSFYDRWMSLDFSLTYAHHLKLVLFGPCLSHSYFSLHLKKLLLLGSFYAFLHLSSMECDLQEDR